MVMLGVVVGWWVGAGQREAGDGRARDLDALMPDFGALSAALRTTRLLRHPSYFLAGAWR
ncbi:hypothetical protein [Leptothrix ochracea]|uniref:hypothetical protein n=1 Tax=Leptothrix ochracea TaxID=735331 RepID=UPI0034E24910